MLQWGNQMVKVASVELTVVALFSRQAERGELKVERYVDHEAGLIVRRAFGASKRLSQAEKNDIHHLVSLRTQCAKEVWQVGVA